MRLWAAIFKKNLLEFVRYPIDFAFSFLMPFAFFLPVYFLIQSFAPGGDSPGLESWIGSNDFYGFIFTGVITGYVVMSIFWGIGFALKRLMDIGLLETIWVFPISKTAYILGESLFSLFRLVWEIAIVMVLFRWFFGIAAPEGFVRVLPFFLPFVFLMYGFGIAFASIVLLAKNANDLVDTSSFLVYSLSGTQNPPQVFPPLILALSLALPITYFVDVVRVYSLGIDPLVPLWIELVILFSSAAIFPALGIWFFRRVDRLCRIKGNLHVH